MPGAMLRSRRESGETFYCPNGHARLFRETEVQRLEKLLAAEKATAERERAARAAANAEARLAREARDAAQAKLARVKRRVGNGVCPCCNRTFQQLARHMKAKHPKYEASHG